MMHLELNANYYENKNVQVIELLYKKEEYNKEADLSAIIILPNSETDIDDFIANEAKFNIDSVNEYLNSMKNCKVDFFLPKFKVETSANLSGALKNSGLEICFGNSADFSNFADSLDVQNNLKISDVIQKGFLAVDEKGTEASVVTAVKLRKKCKKPPKKKIIMRVDHPFLFLIKKKSVNQFLFICKIESL